MLTNVIVAGFGGQGILFAGQVLAYAGLYDDKQVVWSAIYGPEMRGGTANCTVILSSSRIQSPLVERPFGVIAMNRPSFDRFSPLLRPGGVLVFNSSLVDATDHQTDVVAVDVPATRIAEELGNARVANMVALGAYVAATGVVSVDSIAKGIEKLVPENRVQLRTLNCEAFKKGFDRLAALPELPTLR